MHEGAVSAIYRGVVRHRRHRPRGHSFAYQTYMFFLDLDELPGLISKHWWLSGEGWNICSFRRKDYLGPLEVPLKEAVLNLCESRLGFRPKGRVCMLSHASHFGFCFNPVSFYYAYQDDDLAAIVAEITNTPWGEKHRYVFDAREVLTYAFSKEFHVSPFMAMDLDYQWRFGVPEDRLDVFMRLDRAGQKLFDASLSLRREFFSGRSVRRQLLHRPFITVQTVAAIYWQAARLWLKRIPFHAHPKTSSRP